MKIDSVNVNCRINSLDDLEGIIKDLREIEQSEASGVPTYVRAKANVKGMHVKDYSIIIDSFWVCRAPLEIKYSREADKELKRIE